MSRIKKLFRRIVCLFKGHKYIPAYWVYSSVSGKRTHTYYVYDCARCSTPTRPMKKKERIAFEKKEKPSYANYDHEIICNQLHEKVCAKRGRG